MWSTKAQRPRCDLHKSGLANRRSLCSCEFLFPPAVFQGQGSGTLPQHIWERVQASTRHSFWKAKASHAEPGLSWRKGLEPVSAEPGSYIHHLAYLIQPFKTYPLIHKMKGLNGRLSYAFGRATVLHLSYYMSL